MQTAASDATLPLVGKTDDLKFTGLPRFCRFLAEHHLEEFTSDQLRLSREVQVPLLRYFSHMPEEQLMALAVQGIRELFDAIADNNLRAYLEKSTREWKENQLPIVSRDEVVTEDITLVSYVRKKSFLKFLPLYTQNFTEFSIIVDEIDRFLLVYETLSFQTYADILTQELRRNEMLYQQAQAISHLGNWTWNVASGEVRWTDELYRIFGLKPQSEKITFERYVSLLHPEDRNAVVTVIQKALGEKRSYEIAHRVLLDDGSVRFIQSKGETRIGENGLVTEMVGTAQDVTEDTERKRNEARLKESEERFRAVADTAPVMIWKGGADKQRHWFNKGWLEYTGRTLEQEIGFGWVDGVHPEDRERFLSAYDKAYETRTDFILEYRLRRHDGEYRWVAVHGVPRYDPNGEFIGFIGSVGDIHERKRMRRVLEQQVQERTAALQKINQELERSNRELSSFSYVASHDLQEPLRKIQTFSSRVLEREFDRLSDNGKESLNRMNEAAARMKQLIEDLLTYSRINTASRTFAPVDLNTVLKNVLSVNSETLEERKAIVTSTPLPVVNGIAYQLNQLFENLIGNALKYAKPDVPPKITVSYTPVSKEEAKKLQLPVNDATYGKITFADNGIGFDQKHAQRIFEVFQRLHNRGEYAGTGIGLSICKKIAENHDGLINASGESGVGATFNVYLPVTS